jgi:Flp pilus assembly protein TadD
MINDTALRELHLARGLKSIGSKSDAVAAYYRALEIQSDCFEALQELGQTLWELGRLKDVIPVAEAIIKLRPNDSIGYVLLGSALVENSNITEAISLYKKAISLDPNNSILYNALALAFKETQDFEQSFTFYDKAISLAPTDADVRNNLAILLLLTGDYRRGFKEYEWRKYKQERYGNREFIQPLWQGENLEGKTLLIHHEQGMGDAIQFSRYVKLLHESSVNLIYAAHPPLIKLLSSMADISFVDVSNASIPFDYHCPLLSLPLRMETCAKTIPADVPYLSVEPSRLHKWQNRIGPDGFKIGVAWQGSGGRFAKNRLFPVSYLKPLQELPGVRLIGLHQSPLHSPWSLPEALVIENLGPDFDAGQDAFLDTAAAIQCCDLVISCDTAVAHLAGALGKQAWVVLRHVPHWVWMMDREDSDWYPSLRLFRQKKAGDWDSVFMEIYVELSRLIDSGKYFPGT